MRVYTTSLRPGTVLAESVFTDTGEVLLKKGTELTRARIALLRETGITEVGVGEAQTGPRKGQMISEELVSRSLSFLTVVYETAKSDLLPSIKRLNARAEHLAALLRSELLQTDARFRLVEVAVKRSHLPPHALNVCLLAMMIARRLDMNEAMIRDIAVGALLHDLGMTALPGILEARTWGPSQSTGVRKHPEMTLRLMTEIEGTSSLARIMAYQHHERCDGSGYPQGITAADIYLPSKLLAVADVYCALNAERPYGARLLPHQAVEFMKMQARTELDPEMVELLVECVDGKHKGG